MLCRLMKVLQSIGVSTLDGWGMGSHSTTRQVRRGSVNPDKTWGGRLGYTFKYPVQCSTWGKIHMTSDITRKETGVHWRVIIINCHYRVQTTVFMHVMYRNPHALTFQLADLRLTVRPLLVTVHFILMKKSLAVLSSLCLLPYAEPNSHIQGIYFQYYFRISLIHQI